jgi:xanthine permease
MSTTPVVSEKHPVDQMLPFGRLAVLGLQHVLVMYAGCVAVPLIVGGALKLPTATIAVLVNADLFVAGLITIVQSLGVGRILGVRLPIVAGATFTALSPMILIGSKYGMPAVYGAMLSAGVFGLLIAKPFAKIIHLFPPLVTGTVITVIGLSLIEAGAGLIAGNDATSPDYGNLSHLALAASIILLIVLINRFARGFFVSLAVLIGLIFGVIVAAFMGLVDFSGVGDAGWFGLAQPFYFGAPHFPIAAVVSMCVVMLVIFVESTADMLAVAQLTGKQLTEGDIARGLAADGVSGVLAGTFNSFLDTAFAQNVGLVQITRVRSRFVVTAAGVILVLLGLIPKLGEVVASVPGPVIGGDRGRHPQLAPGRIRGQPEPADHRGLARRRDAAGGRAELLRQTAQRASDHLRQLDHHDGDHRLRAQPPLQRRQAPRGGDARSRTGSERPGFRTAGFRTG